MMKDHLILSLVFVTKEGKIKSKITTLRKATMKEIDDIARAENCIASIKDQTNSPPNHRAYKSDGITKKECNKCRDTSHLATKCNKKKLWRNLCKSTGHIFGA